MISNLLILSLKYIAKDLVGDFLYWPIWWYSKGLINATLFSFRAIRNQQETLGLSIWIKNIFTPMYGQTDWEGRLISFVMRLIQIIVRGVMMLVWSFLAVMPIIIWVLLPLTVVVQIYLNLVVLLA